MTLGSCGATGAALPPTVRGAVCIGFIKEVTTDTVRDPVKATFATAPVRVSRRVPFVPTDFAHATATVTVGIFGSVFVSLRAVCFGELMLALGATLDVLGARHWFHVTRVDTRAVPAEVVDGQTLRYGAAQAFISEPMGLDPLFFPVEKPVPENIESAGPDPATVRLVTDTAAEAFGELVGVHDSIITEVDTCQQT